MCSKLLLHPQVIFAATNSNELTQVEAAIAQAHEIELHEHVEVQRAEMLLGKLKSEATAIANIERVVKATPASAIDIAAALEHLKACLVVSSHCADAIRQGEEKLKQIKEYDDKLNALELAITSRNTTQLGSAIAAAETCVVVVIYAFMYVFGVGANPCVLFVSLPHTHPIPFSNLVSCPKLTSSNKRYSLP